MVQQIIILAMQNCVVLGFLGTTLDRGDGPERWTRWRPTVSLFQHEELLIARLELIHGSGSAALAAQVIEDIQRVSPETEVRTHALEFRNPWDFEEVYGALYDFAAGYAFDTERERYLLHITTGTHVAQICIFLLTESRHFPGQLIQTGPPKREGTMQPGRYAIIDLDRSQYDRIAQRFAREQREATAFLKAGIATRNAAFNRMIDEIEHVAIHSRAPLLLTGPTGSGKSSLARRIYELKKTRHQLAGRLVEVNCATIRGDGAMSALFGHRRGAFTGAAQDRAGHLRDADRGLLFLDEVGELGPDEQAMLLQAIETHRFYPLGSDRVAQSDFQLICGTNRDLAAAVRGGAFREDLLARINLWTFEMPQLRARPEDIEPNIEYELRQLAATTGRSYRFNAEARERFLQFAAAADSAWSGNFRDLNACMARMATMSPAGRITVETVDKEIERLRKAWGGVGLENEYDADLTALMGTRAADLDEFDRVQLAHVLRVCRSAATLSAAGRRLFAVSRTRRSVTNDADRLRKYLARFGIDSSRLWRD